MSSADAPRVAERTLEMARDVVDAVQRIATALERIADASNARPRRRQMEDQRAPDLPVTETDRAAARKAARRLGLVVRGPAGSRDVR